MTTKSEQKAQEAQEAYRAYIDKIVAEAPPLTEEQIRLLRALRGVAR